MMYQVYLLESEKTGKYYIGYTGDIETRLSHHNAGKVKSTRYMRPLKLVYLEMYESEADARRREHYLKRLKSKRALQQLVMSVGH